MDLVSPRGISTIASAQVKFVFTRALAAEGIHHILTERQHPFDASDQGSQPTVLIAISDNGPQMRSRSIEEFMAFCAVGPYVLTRHPQDQARIESLDGHIKGQCPHLSTTRDPAPCATNWPSCPPTKTPSGFTKVSAA